MKFYKQTIIFIVLLFNAPTYTWAMQQPVLVLEKPIAAPVDSMATVDSAQPEQTSIDQSFKSSSYSKSANSSGPSSPSIGVDKGPDGDNYPLLGRMEVITFGQSKSNSPVEERLSALEQAVFRTNYKDQTLFDRTKRLRQTILGGSDAAEGDQDISSLLPPLLTPPGRRSPVNTQAPEITYFDLVAQNQENQIEVSPCDLPGFALQLANYARVQLGITPLTMDSIALRMADEQVNDLRKRRLVSHANERGETPDLRYTTLGGTGAVMEGVIALSPEHIDEVKYKRALVARVFKLLIERQDDRDALLSPDATGFGFAISLLSGERKAVACVEVSTNRGTVIPVTLPLSVGDKVEIKGTIEPPYKFAKVTLAWEGLTNNLSSASDESEEALPYFPPLDYVGFAHHCEHDYSKAMTALRMGALVGVIAGGMFIPPVALAAPLIMLSPAGSEPKAMSDIPLHGGIKVEGDSFSGKVIVSNNGKPGIYYLTVWATADKNPKPVPISRRAFMVMNGKDIEESKPIANIRTQS